MLTGTDCDVRLTPVRPLIVFPLVVHMRTETWCVFALKKSTVGLSGKRQRRVCRAADDGAICTAAGPATALSDDANRGRAVWERRGSAACSTAFGVFRNFTSAPRAVAGMQKEVCKDHSREALAGDYMRHAKKERSILQDSHCRIN